MKKQPYQLSLDDWEAALSRGPVRLRLAFLAVTVEKHQGTYSYRTDFGTGQSLVTSHSLSQLFLQVLFNPMSFADSLTVEADSTFVAMLPGGTTTV